jgi:Domain of unknown function (DUF3560)
VLRGHHSERRHRRDIARADAHMGQSVAETARSEYHADRAAAAAAYQGRREDPGTMLRRIARLEADERRLLRDIEGGTRSHRGYSWEVTPATGEGAERLGRELASVREQLAYWRGLIEEAETSGVRVWSQADFARGDFVSFRKGRWSEVVRANKTTLTIRTGANIGNAGTDVPGIGRVVRSADVKDALGEEGWTLKFTYSEVAARMSAAEMAEAVSQAGKAAGDAQA